jgi:hypothetical protein
MDDLTHHHLTLYSGDWERLKEIYGNNPRLPPTKVVRELVRAHLRRVADRMTDREFTENALKPPLSHGGKNV